MNFIADLLTLWKEIAHWRQWAKRCGHAPFSGLTISGGEDDHAMLGGLWAYAVVVSYKALPMLQSAEQHRYVVDTGFFWRMGGAADSRIRVGIVVGLIAVAFALLDFLADVVGHYIAHPVAVAAVRAAIVGVVAGALTWVGLIAARQRRQYISGEINRIADLNHRIRNSLEVIADAQYFSEDPVRGMVLESVARIDKTLQDVLPSIKHR